MVTNMISYCNEFQLNSFSYKIPMAPSDWREGGAYGPKALFTVYVDHQSYWKYEVKERLCKDDSD